MTYNRFCGIFADKLLLILLVLAKVAIGLFALAVLSAIGFIAYAAVS